MVSVLAVRIRTTDVQTFGLSAWRDRTYFFLTSSPDERSGQLRNVGRKKVMGKLDGKVAVITG
jgi:hypothetical protein